MRHGLSHIASILSFSDSFQERNTMEKIILTINTLFVQWHNYIVEAAQKQATNNGL